VLDYLLSWDLEQPEGLMLTNILWSVLKDHLEFLSTEDNSLRCRALEKWLQRLLVFIREYFLPLKLISL
jgi:hypothetical protein